VSHEQEQGVSGCTKRIIVALAFKLIHPSLCAGLHEQEKMGLNKGQLHEGYNDTRQQTTNSSFILHAEEQQMLLRNALLNLRQTPPSFALTCFSH